MPDAGTEPAYEPARASGDRWEATLDAFAEAVRGHAAVAAGALPLAAVVDFAWPADLGELPEQLVERAHELVQQSDALANRHQARLASLAGQSRLLALQPLAQPRSRMSLSG